MHSPSRRSPPHPRRPWQLARNLGAGLAVALLAALPASPPQARVRNAEDLLIVDCLLPGQIRKLGANRTFMSARRPIRTTQADCEIRGGEFVSYDRANYQTALTVWLGQAEGGDAEAQNYVGEIYMKGLGAAPDYAKAASWLEKSVAQGNKRAMTNLGYLHEEGLGVPKDAARAINLYRQASGASGDEVVFASTVKAQSDQAQAEISSLRQTVEQQRAQIDAMQKQLDDRRRALGAAQGELRSAREKLVAQQAALAPAPEAEALRAKEAELAAQEQQLAGERAALQRDQSAWDAKVRDSRNRLADLKAQEQDLSGKLAGGADATQAATLRQDLERVRSAASELALALDDAINKSAALEARVAANDARVSAEQARFEAERKQMQAALAASQQDRELLLLLEQQLSEKQREVAGQREQIAALERQAVAPAGGTGLVAALSMSGPLLEIIEPALSVTRGRPAAMVPRSQGSSSEVLGKVVARGGLDRVEVNGTAVAVGAGGLFRVSVPVGASGSDVRVSAIDKAGTRTALEFQLLPAPGGGTVPGSAPSGTRRMPSGVALGRYHALVIGANNYTGYTQLASAVNDAQKVAGVLKSRYGFQTQLLLNPTRLDILAALDQMREELKPEDNLMVYFAGHGEIDQASKQGYWLGVDARQGQPSSWIPNRAVSDILNAIPARHVLVVADSCYSGAMTRASVPRFAGAQDDAQWSAWVKSMNQSRSRTALTSGGLAPVPDSAGGGNSLFARALLNALEDNNQLLEGQKLFREVTATVAMAAAESNLLQAPEYAPIQFAGHEAGEFFFAPKG